MCLIDIKTCNGMCCLPYGNAKPLAYEINQYGT